MQFMLLLKGDPPVNAPADAPTDAGQPAGAAPPIPDLAGLVAAMDRYNEELTRAGVLLAVEGLFPSGMGGARVVYQGGRRTVVDGPFAEAKELVAGYYLIDVKSREEAIEWASRCPVEYAVRGDQEAVVEVRQVGAAPDEFQRVYDAIVDEARPATGDR